MFLFPTQLALGAAYGTAKSGTGIAAMAVMRPDLVIKSVIPVVMAGIIAIYGLVVAVLIANGCKFYGDIFCACLFSSPIVCLKNVSKTISCFIALGVKQ